MNAALMGRIYPGKNGLRQNASALSSHINCVILWSSFNPGKHIVANMGEHRLDHSSLFTDNNKSNTGKRENRLFFHYINNCPSHWFSSIIFGKSMTAWKRRRREKSIHSHGDAFTVSNCFDTSSNTDLQNNTDRQIDSVFFF